MSVIQTVASIFRGGRHLATANANTSIAPRNPIQEPPPDDKNSTANENAIRVNAEPRSVAKNESPRRTTSPRKAEANRQNAKRSTGPKTDRGKAVSSRNALKYGVYSAEGVVTEGDGKENVKEYRALLAELERDLKPVGVLERALVETIANQYWRRRRVLRHERGQILSKTGNVRADTLAAQANDLEVYRTNPVVYSVDLRQSSLGLLAMFELLKIMEQEINEHRGLSQRTYDDLVKYFGQLPVFDNYAQEDTDEPNPDEPNPDEPDPNEPDPDAEQRLRAWIAEKREHIAAACFLAEKREQIDINAQLASGCLPKAPIEILKLDRKYQKEINRALDELRRLQAMRRAEDASPCDAPQE